MALANYTDLQASLANWLHRTDLTAMIPDFITLAEARIARDLRLRSQVTSATLGTTAGVRAVDLPTGWLEFENVTLTGNPDKQLTYLNIQHLDTRFPGNDYTGSPYFYSIEGSQILFGPIPDSVYSVPILFYKRFDPLATTATNWLLTNHPSIYLFGSLAEAAPFLQQDERVAMWESKYKADIDSLQTSDDMAQFSGSALVVKAI